MNSFPICGHTGARFDACLRSLSLRKDGLVRIFLMFGLLIPAAAFPFFGDDSLAGEDLWVSGDQYMRLVRREDSSTQPHEHPTKQVATTGLYEVLRSLEVRRKPGILNFGSKKPQPIFTPEMAQLLAGSLSRGLAQAGPEEELIFVLIGFYKGTLLKERKAVGGRVFFRAGHLHFLLGDVLRSVDYGAERDVRGLQDEVDRRLHPFYPGSRDREGAQSWEVLLRDGIALQEFAGESRADWLVLDLPRLLADLQQEPATVPDASSAAASPVPAPAASAQQQRLIEELRQQRIEMARMRKRMQEMQPETSVPARSISARLQTLETLHEQGLVSEEEYQAKRRELLDAL